MKSNVVLVNRSASPYHYNANDKSVTNISAYVDSLGSNASIFNNEIYGIRLTKYDDIDLIKQLDPQLISTIHVPFNLAFIPYESEFFASYEFICSEVIADLDTPLGILTEQIIEYFDRGYKSVILELYSDQWSPVKSLSDLEYFPGELSQSDIHELIMEFSISIGLANTSIDDLDFLPKNLLTDPIYLYL